MIKAYQEAKLKDNNEVLRADAQFDKALEALRTAGIEYPLSTIELSQERMQFPKTHTLNTQGSYTSEGFLHAKDSPVLVARISPLVKDRTLAQKAVAANYAGSYFTTDSRELYDKHANIAEADKNKSPYERNVIILPSRIRFLVSPTENAEAFEFFFGKNGKNYLAHCDRNDIMVYPVVQEIVDAQEGTLLTQSWLRGLDGGSYVYGDGRNLYLDGRVRGVRKASVK